jgi:hypothetical protein
MTMLDDDLLADLFARAAEGLPAPETGSADILERAFGAADAPEGDGEDGVPTQGASRLSDLTKRQVGRSTRFVRQHRVLSAAAVVVLAFVVAGSATWIGRSSSTPNTTAALGSPSTTTLPIRHAVPPNVSSGQGTTGNGGAPFSPGATNAGPTSVAPQPGSGPSSASPAPAASAPALPNNAFQSARIAQTGTLSLTVGKGTLAQTMTKLGFFVAEFQGFVADQQTESGATSTTGAPNGTITLQVPVDSFSSLLKKAQTLGKTNDLTTKATDVTGQYVDLQNRIAALQASRQQYLTILSKANTIGDVLAVQSQLDTIQTQIEQLQGQLNLLTSQTTYSTLTVEVSEKTPKPHPVPVTHRSGLSTAWHDSVHGFVDGVEGIIRLAGPVLFALLCAAVLLFGGRALWRRYQRHNL